MDIIDGSGLWSVTAGAALPPPPPVSITVGGGIIRDKIEERIPEVKIPEELINRIKRRIKENKLLEIFFIADDDI